MCRPDPPASQDTPKGLAAILRIPFSGDMLTHAVHQMMGTLLWGLLAVAPVVLYVFSLWFGAIVGSPSTGSRAPRTPAQSQTFFTSLERG